MFFQKILKGISGIQRSDADECFTQGIICNWWRRMHTITNVQRLEKLTPRNLDWHLNHYDDHDPFTNAPFSKNTPYISATAGTVERDVFALRNIVYDPRFTALRFATNDFTTTGYVFYAYLFTLGKEAIPLEEFAEEVRELNIYKNFLPFHPEGEITAKIVIRGPQIERWEEYDGPAAERELRNARLPQPRFKSVNSSYAAPERYCNIRGLVTD